MKDLLERVKQLKKYATRTISVTEEEFRQRYAAATKGNWYARSVLATLVQNWESESYLVECGGTRSGPYINLQGCLDPVSLVLPTGKTYLATLTNNVQSLTSNLIRLFENCTHTYTYEELHGTVVSPIVSASHLSHMMFPGISCVQSTVVRNGRDIYWVGPKNTAVRINSMIPFLPDEFMENNKWLKEFDTGAGMPPTNPCLSYFFSKEIYGAISTIQNVAAFAPEENVENAIKELEKLRNIFNLGGLQA